MFGILENGIFYAGEIPAAMPILPDHAVERRDLPLLQHGGAVVLLETPDPHSADTGLNPDHVRIVEHLDRPLVR